MEALEEDNKVLFLSCADSTNTWLKEQILKQALSCAAVFAGRQTAGRGRHGRHWESPEGGLYLSISFPFENQNFPPIFSCVAAGVAIAGILRREPYTADVFLKWPNDIFAGGRKLCGMLSELVTAPGIAPHVVIGIGLNVNAKVVTADSLYEAVSLFELKGHEFDVRLLAEQIVSEFRREWRNTVEFGTEQLISHWCALSETPGAHVEVLQDENRFAGYCVGVSDAFELIVENENGSRRFSAGDCRTLRQPGVQR